MKTKTLNYLTRKEFVYKMEYERIHGRYWWYRVYIKTTEKDGWMWVTDGRIESLFSPTRKLCRTLLTIAETADESHERCGRLAEFYRVK